ncbi:fimbrial protein [Enterobacter asburiae]|uniref:fimbrial protein n=1 Tax=Enterobacter asburiae TaxID=61645 RepID=UPI002FF941E7
MIQSLQRFFSVKGSRFLPAAACAAGALAMMPALANQISVNVRQTVVPANCDLALNGGDMTGGVVDFGALQSADLSGPGRVSASKSFNLVLSGCGVNATTVAPHITVSGKAMGAGNDAYLFKDGGTSEGLGFIFRFDGNRVAWTSGNADEKNMQPGDDITTTLNAHGAQLPTQWLNATIPVAVAVSTGERSAQAAGDLTATATFTFDYR